MTVQPMWAKRVLPAFGGAAAVWTTALALYQLLLLAGYCYAHGLTRWPVRRQRLVHSLLLLVSLLVPLFGLLEPLRNLDSAHPARELVRNLTISVGMPFLMLAATSSLVQSWYHRQTARSPYSLYAVSNAGSLCGVLGYPLLIEPWLAVDHQLVLWMAAYVVQAGILVWLQRHAIGQDQAPVSAGEAPPAVHRLLWFLLPACTTAILVGVSELLTLNVSAAPILWVLPLSAYLLTFILAFRRGAKFRRQYSIALACFGMAVLWIFTAAPSSASGVSGLLAGCLAALFWICLAGHGELASLRPEPRWLTLYYLLITAGGAAGGFFVSLVAPEVFRRLDELPYALLAFGFTLCLALIRGEAWGRRALRMGVAGLCALLNVAMLVAYMRRTEDAVWRGRNFYGPLSVRLDGEGDEQQKLLEHGNILHGAQFVTPQKHRLPTTYYGPTSGAGLALRTCGAADQRRVGVVGLGAGTLLAYGEPGNYFRLYELNPLVADVARWQFFFLRESRARYDIVLGDARLQLEREAPQGFDVLVLDAFSSDAIPVHLLTREAFQLYWQHVKPEGVIAAHISNRFVDLRPVLAATAAGPDVEAVLIRSGQDQDKGMSNADWVLLGRRQRSCIEKLVSQGVRLEEVSQARPWHVWTDRYSNLVAVLKLRR
jgi:hypothetical protein